MTTIQTQERGADRSFERPFAGRITIGRPEVATGFRDRAEWKRKRIEERRERLCKLMEQKPGPERDREGKWIQESLREDLRAFRAYETLARLHDERQVPTELYHVRQARHVDFLIEHAALDDATDYKRRQITSALKWTSGHRRGYRKMCRAFEVLGLTDLPTWDAPLTLPVERSGRSPGIVAGGGARREKEPTVSVPEASDDEARREDTFEAWRGRVDQMLFEREQVTTSVLYDLAWLNTYQQGASAKEAADRAVGSMKQADEKGELPRFAVARRWMLRSLVGPSHLERFEAALEMADPATLRDAIRFTEGTQQRALKQRLRERVSEEEESGARTPSRTDEAA